MKLNWPTYNLKPINLYSLPSGIYMNKKEDKTIPVNIPPREAPPIILKCKSKPKPKGKGKKK